MSGIIGDVATHEPRQDDVVRAGPVSSATARSAAKRGGAPGSGPAAPFADLHPALAWHADRLDVRVRFDSRVALAERGLVIIPSAFHREGVAPIVDPPWQPTLVYPARGLAAGLVTAGATGREVLYLRTDPAERLLASLPRDAAITVVALAASWSACLRPASSASMRAGCQHCPAWRRRALVVPGRRGLRCGCPRWSRRSPMRSISRRASRRATVLRSCLIGMRVGAGLGLDPGRRAALFWALLLKDAGCSSNAARIYALLDADDQRVESELKTVDWPQLAQRARYALRVAVPDRGVAARLRRVAWLARQGDLQGELVGLRCERGAEIALLARAARRDAAAIRALDEHWDGTAALKACAARTSAARADQVPRAVGRGLPRVRGRRTGREMARDRNGRWFDPRSSRRWNRWPTTSAVAEIAAPPAELNVALRPMSRRISPHGHQQEVDRLVAASPASSTPSPPYTLRHSERVAALSVQLGTALGLAE